MAAQAPVEEGLVREFKTRRCTLWDAGSHDHRACPFFHGDRDRRRAVLGAGQRLLYSADPCGEKFDSTRSCSKGDACGFCHSTAELLYHPDIFRKRLCHQGTQCLRGRFCAFAHSRRELLVPHFTEADEWNPSEDFIAHHFKTQWCPIGGPHDWEACVYAHTYRDWRRVPAIGYSSRPCPHWSRSTASGPSEMAYGDRCPRGMACPLAHGSKEQLYHPSFYKTNPCSEKQCKRGALCAFNHGPCDARRGSEADAPVQPPLRERDLLPDTEELLAVLQPTCLQPPKYHALEDPSRTSSTGGSASSGPAPKGRGRGGARARGRGPALPTRSRPALAAVTAGPDAWAPAWAGPAEEDAWGEQARSFAGVAQLQESGPWPHMPPPSSAGGCGRRHPSFPEHFVPYYCQWMSYADPNGQTLHYPDYGSGESVDHWGAPTHDGFRPLVWDMAAMPLLSAQAATMPSTQSRWMMEAEETAEAGAEADVLPADVESLPSLLALDGLLQSVEGLSQQPVGGRGAKHGLRTPSWSPPQSATPTEVPSPRPVELTAGSSGGSGHASPDDVVPALEGRLAVAGAAAGAPGPV